MLSFIPAPSPYAPQYQHARTFAPSPLALRDPNTLAPSTFQNPFSKPFSMTTSTPSSEPSKHSVFQPISRLSPSPVATINARATKDNRRERFFAKNRQQREEARFEGRGEIGLRKAFVDERRRWEDRLTREAPRMEVWEDAEDVNEEGDMMDQDGMVGVQGWESPPEEEEFGEIGDVGGDEGEGKRDSQEFYDEEYEEIFAEIAVMEDGGMGGEAMAGLMDKSGGETGMESKDSNNPRDTTQQEESHDMDMTD